jgi:hypothetical protein
VQDGVYPRANPAFANVEGSIGWHAVAPHAAFGERVAQSFCGVRCGDFTAPLRHRSDDHSGAHWSNVRFVSLSFWLVGGLVAVCVWVFMPPRRHEIPRARVAAVG